MMLTKFKKFFAPDSPSDTEESKEHKLQLACATLLVEVMQADFKQTEDENHKIQKLLKSTFKLNESELEDLMEKSNQGDETTAVHPFTSLLNEHYEYEQRVHLIELMWKVAYADGKLDKYEDSVIRKVAELLYIRHSDFIKTKLAEADKYDKRDAP
jgi:uncharacterized tellurite resistance protein B-like protein